MATRTVLFVCLHGAAKSVLAAVDFERLARERGLDAPPSTRGWRGSWASSREREGPFVFVLPDPAAPR